jgi:hypothetical protein
MKIDVPVDCRTGERGRLGRAIERRQQRPPATSIKPPVPTATPLVRQGYQDSILLLSILRNLIDPLWGVGVAHRALPFGPSHLVSTARWRFKSFGLRKITSPVPCAGA